MRWTNEETRTRYIYELSLFFSRGNLNVKIAVVRERVRRVENSTFFISPRPRINRFVVTAVFNNCGFFFFLTSSVSASADKLNEFNGGQTHRWSYKEEEEEEELEEMGWGEKKAKTPLQRAREIKSIV